VKAKAEELASLSDKEIGLMLDEIPEISAGSFFHTERIKGIFLPEDEEVFSKPSVRMPIIWKDIRHPMRWHALWTKQVN